MYSFLLNVFLLYSFCAFKIQYFVTAFSVPVQSSKKKKNFKINEDYSASWDTHTLLVIWHWVSLLSASQDALRSAAICLCLDSACVCVLKEWKLKDSE